MTQLFLIILDNDTAEQWYIINSCESNMCFRSYSY